MASIIELDRLSKHYSSSIVAVDNVTFAVEDGEFVTLLGPSGCGKSTLLRMIGGFEDPTDGAIWLAGKNVTWDPPHRRDVNMVFQDYALFPHMTVGENIGYGLKLKKLNRTEIGTSVQGALSLVGLEDKIDQHPYQLSGGQRQRIALARAIVRRPKVLLLDEPLSALDAKLRGQMQLELKHLHEKVGISFIMVTHDQTEALVMSDRVVVMDSGRVAQEGSPNLLYDNPNSPYVANFIGTTNFLDAQIARVDGDRTRISVAGVEIEAVGETHRRAGDAITVGFRPEKVRILKDGETGDNEIPGEIAEVVYYGLGLRLSVAVQGGGRVYVDSLLPDRLADSQVPPVGHPVRMALSSGNIFLFDEGVA
ncbi:putative spermidine/putrescine transport system ATP-binding protein [Salinihabitans flavidus]|uniref:Spermidine/putrescine import ATP-binding protein PotA n=1 Tax=Salinihabitans flavidus TaxID=569882 RepID=A0A1H8VE55_9RHOB|nr:ABC transporter ATP-binding protein [Salinihabitans flavidus]SEP13497.1 putative spermidine/putrescine transport system ATP-binding protein [Salinihabitans flavidus]